MLPAKEDVIKSLEAKLAEMKSNNLFPDSITFAGNGEPCLHPDFSKIISSTINLRNQYCHDTIISVLSNSTMIFDDEVFKALKKVDRNILKIDSVTDKSLRVINQIPEDFKMSQLINKMIEFNGDLIIQTMFIRGVYKGEKFDNTTESELKKLIQAYKKINPKEIMIYSVSRNTPVEEIEIINADELNKIANLIKAYNLNVNVF